MDGIDFLVAIVGLFAIAEVFFFIESHGKGSSIGVKLDKVTILGAISQRPRGQCCVPRVWVHRRHSARCGCQPWQLSCLYDREIHRWTPRVALAQASPKGSPPLRPGNNAAAGGALVPMLTLGVPGSGTTAVLLALLMTLNITPGPTLFTDRPEVVWGLIALLLIANIVLLLMNVPMVKIFVKVLMVPAWVLLPGGTMISFVGIYSLSAAILICC